MKTVFYEHVSEEFEGVFVTSVRKAVIAEGEEFDDLFIRSDGWVKLGGEGGSILLPPSSVLMIDKRDDEYS